MENKEFIQKAFDKAVNLIMADMSDVGEDAALVNIFGSLMASAANAKVHKMTLEEYKIAAHNAYIMMDME